MIRAARVPKVLVDDCENSLSHRCLVWHCPL